jgi:hypothetical protein
MEIIKQIIESARGTLPQGSRTAAAIERQASVEEISTCAAEEGLHSFAGALFEACEQGGADDETLDGSAKVLGAVGERLLEFRHELPGDCETARLIDAGASLEEISEAAQHEGLTSLATLLFEAEQEQNALAA